MGLKLIMSQELYHSTGVELAAAPESLFHRTNDQHTCSERGLAAHIYICMEVCMLSYHFQSIYKHIISAQVPTKFIETEAVLKTP